MRMPGILTVFWSVTLVNLWQGIPPTRTRNAPVIERVIAITVCETTPMSAPGVSPKLIGFIVSRLCAGVAMKSTL